MNNNNNNNISWETAETQPNFLKKSCLEHTNTHTLCGQYLKVPLKWMLENLTAAPRCCFLLKCEGTN